MLRRLFLHVESCLNGGLTTLSQKSIISSKNLGKQLVPISNLSVKQLKSVIKRKGDTVANVQFTTEVKFLEHV